MVKGSDPPAAVKIAPPPKPILGLPVAEQLMIVEEIMVAGPVLSKIAPPSPFIYSLSADTDLISSGCPITEQLEIVEVAIVAVSLLS